MDLAESGGLILRRAETSLETVKLRGLELQLIGSGDGTEVIHHRLSAGSLWGLYPAEGWNALEFVYILSGSLSWHSPKGEHIMRPGDSISAQPVTKESLFVAKSDCEFLYVSSEPVFHHYSQNTKELMRLAVEIEEKDGNTSDHCQKILTLSTLMGEKMDLSPTEMFHLNYGAFLHDIGKVKVPDRILGKPGKLTDDEYQIMKKHSYYGRQMLHDTGLPNLQKAGVIVERHHERFDGSGYPHALKGGEIDICSAIVAVVDTYDAITSDRVYRKGRTKEEALNELEHWRANYHPEVLAAFFQIAGQL
jgi:putative nucleotidyltransferase with HDIG domain